MKLVKLFIVATAVALFAIACGNSDSTNQTATSNTTTQPTPSGSPKPTASATPQDELADAKKSYAQVCANCHGDNGEGGPVKIEGKTLKVPSLKEGHALKHSDEEFVKQITKGGGGMPPFKDKLTPEQINNIVKYLRRDIQGSAAPKAGD